MTTTPVDRDVIRAWRDTHSNIQPDRDGNHCERMVWMNRRPAGRCGKTSKWIVDYAVSALGRMRYCEYHTVELITLWTNAEKEEGR